MSLTPNRDAAAATCAEARRQYAARGSRGPALDIANRMDVDTTEAVLFGFGDLMDLGVGLGASGDMVVRALGSALASFLLTATAGRVPMATSCLEGALSELRTRTLERLSRAHSEGIAAAVVPSEPQGRA